MIGYYFKEHEPNSLPKLYLLYALMGAPASVPARLPFNERGYLHRNLLPVYPIRRKIADADDSARCCPARDRGNRTLASFRQDGTLAHNPHCRRYDGSLGCGVCNDRETI